MSRRILIVGANGLLGRAFVGADVVRASHGHAADLHLDLSLDPPYELPADVSHAVVCSSLTNIDECFRDPKGTARFNVGNTIRLLDQLTAAGVVPVFCSSDAVFSGDDGDYGEDDPRNPIGEYGRQKVAVENHLLRAGNPHIIVRMSKIYSDGPDDTSPVKNWVAKLHAGEEVTAADDQVIVPTLRDDVAEAIRRIIDRGLTGVFHISARERYTRYSLATTLASVAGGGKIKRCRLADLAFAEPRPRNTSLNVDRLEATTGFVPRGLTAVLPRLTTALRMPNR